MPAENTPARPLRADARRNRAAILSAAQDAFAAEGLAVPLDEIARRAGVGAGTVYRHFPTKEALFEAVVLDQLERLAEQAGAARGAADPAEAFYAFVTGLVADAHVKKDLADALAGAGVPLSAGTMAASAALRHEFGELLTAAQAAGAVRADIDQADLHALVLAALTAERHRDDRRRPGRITALILGTLRPGPN
ncbi:TetR/AcrR family transcriptional regulator [Kitasatospora sp. NBC_01287]|uniref:TetR/AcrR family transcriptional regulator n=1 Tax=Kitasatospora sp. NBC_01287 TaxID=2903573 RepID=UPI002252B87B|nr:TetR/AcrR family transcriptional regulator [Kitasatospora sp. NBC_01287]MCX4746326.1 TetR/AcrR family transcriptional regulator [Kitasatospora sp. NBC_01287]